jgi:hypothetical protein
MSRRLHVMGCTISDNVPAGNVAHNYMNHLEHMSGGKYEKKGKASLLETPHIEDYFPPGEYRATEQRRGCR